jgi:predicted MFS family arabinose efflux permease
MLAFQWADSHRAFILASVCFGAGGGICMPALMALAAQKGSRSDAMASVMALMTVAHSLGMLAGALLGGVMMDLFELPRVFSVGALVMVATTVQFARSAFSPRLSHLPENRETTLAASLVHPPRVRRAAAD